MTATINITAEITDFARGVRDRLADLSSEEVDDLTDGLEADMAEAFAETPNFNFPDPATYALELRTAAGLPVKEHSRGSIRQSFGGVADSIRLKRDELARSLRRSPAMAKVLDALVELRPAWWLLRAWVASQIFSAVFGREGATLPFDLFGWVLLLMFVVISVQWGRKLWLPFAWLTGLVVVGNIAAVLLLAPALAASHATSQPYEYDGTYYGEPETMGGLLLDGNEVTNVFAYGADGKPLKGIQLFDQEGRPLDVADDMGVMTCVDAACTDQTETVSVPGKLETGGMAWNIFPQQQVSSDQADRRADDDRFVPRPDAVLLDSKLPFIKVPAILAPPTKTAEKVEKSNE